LRTVGAFAVAGELFKTVEDTVLVFALESVTIATDVNKAKIINSCFIYKRIRNHNIHT